VHIANALEASVKRSGKGIFVYIEYICFLFLGSITKGKREKSFKRRDLHFKCSHTWGGMLMSGAVIMGSSSCKLLTDDNRDITHHEISNLQMRSHLRRQNNTHTKPIW